MKKTGIMALIDAIDETGRYRVGPTECSGIFLVSDLNRGIDILLNVFESPDGRMEFILSQSIVDCDSETFNDAFEIAEECSVHTLGIPFHSEWSEENGCGYVTQFFGCAEDTLSKIPGILDNFECHVDFVLQNAGMLKGSDNCQL